MAARRGSKELASSPRDLAAALKPGGGLAPEEILRSQHIRTLEVLQSVMQGHADLTGQLHAAQRAARSGAHQRCKGRQ